MSCAAAMSALWVDLSTAAEQQDQPVCLVQVVDPVARSVVDAELGDAASDWFDVAGVARGEPIDPDQDPCGSPAILQLA